MKSIDWEIFYTLIVCIPISRPNAAPRTKTGMNIPAGIGNVEQRIDKKYWNI